MASVKANRFGKCNNCLSSGILQAGIYYEGEEKRVGVATCDRCKNSPDANIKAIKSVGLPVDVVQGKARDIVEE